MLISKATFSYSCLPLKVSCVWFTSKDGKDSPSPTPIPPLIHFLSSKESSSATKLKAFLAPVICVLSSNSALVTYLLPTINLWGLSYNPFRSMNRVYKAGYRRNSADLKKQIKWFSLADRKTTDQIYSWLPELLRSIYYTSPDMQHC